MKTVANRNELIVVAGAGGFIGGHLVANLRAQGFQRLRGIDVKPVERWNQRFDDVENLQLDLKARQACDMACADAALVFNLAADMGGMGFIETNKALCMLSVLITTHMLLAARDAGVKRLFYSSSACVYAHDKQTAPDNPGLKETDAYPAMPEDGYGWEKLFGERMCRHFTEDFALETRVARYHNVYGPMGAWDGGREKAPAAICRKVAKAKLEGRREIEIWGDGEQTRSFTHVNDCVEGTLRLMASEVGEPLNIGSEEMVTINELVSLVEAIAGVQLERRYKLDAPEGVRGRNSDNCLIRQRLGWEPSIRLADGMEGTYREIHDEIAAGRIR